MEKSIFLARLFAGLGVIQIIPLTIWAFIGYTLVLPIFLWGIGIALFIFYVRHGLGRIESLTRIKLIWVGSSLFNGLGILAAVLFIFVLSGDYRSINMWIWLLIVSIGVHFAGSIYGSAIIDVELDKN